MSKRISQPGRADDNGEATAGVNAPMEWFKSLARQIVNVSNKKVMAVRKSQSTKSKKAKNSWATSFA
jgi:hypothetical protein